MAELERILDNKPVRPPMISTLAMRWQTVCPPGVLGGTGMSGDGMKEGNDEFDMKERKVPFCVLQ